MYTDAKRFLAINCVLNGHSILDAFDGNVDEAGEAFDASPKVIYGLHTQLTNNLANDYVGSLSPITRAVLNFFRIHDYSFLVLNGTKMYLHDIVASDRNGDIEEEVALAVIRQLLRDVAFVSSEKDIHVSDGTVYIVEGQEKQLMGRIKDAYALLCDGPALDGRSMRTFKKLRDYLTLSNYKTIGTKQGLEFIKELAECGIAATAFRDTTLLIPDYLTTYREVGCLVEQSVDNPGQLLMLAEVKDSTRSKLVALETTALAELLVNSVRDIDNICVGSTGKIDIK